MQRKDRTYIPSTHEGSLKSSTENKAFNSGEETSFKRGGAAALRNFLPTGKITCKNYDKPWQQSGLGTTGEEKAMWEVNHSIKRSTSFQCFAHLCSDNPRKEGGRGRRGWHWPSPPRPPYLMIMLISPCIVLYL